MERPTAPTFQHSWVVGALANKLTVSIFFGIKFPSPCRKHGLGFLCGGSLLRGQMTVTG